LTLTLNIERRMSRLMPCIVVLVHGKPIAPQGDKIR
jgi:hypothetical protein